MAKVGEHNLVVARNIEAKLSLAQIASGRTPAIERRPSVSLPDLVDDLVWPYANLKSSGTFLVALVGNFGLLSCPVSDRRAVEIIVVHLEEEIVVGVNVVDHPLQAMALGEHGRKNKRAGRGRNAVGHKVAALAHERTLVLLPTCRG